MVVGGDFKCRFALREPVEVPLRPVSSSVGGIISLWRTSRRCFLRANRRSRTRFVERAQRLDEAAEVSMDGAPLSFTITAGTSGGREANGDVLPAVDGPELDLHHARHR